MEIFCATIPKYATGNRAKTSRGNGHVFNHNTNQTKSLSYSRYYAEACYQWWSPSPLLSVWATQFPEMRAVGHTATDLTGPGIELYTFRANRDAFNRNATDTHNPGFD